MAEPKTKVTETPFDNWVVQDVLPVRQHEARVLDTLFRAATGFAPQIWTGGIVGYGAYDYTYASGRSGTWMATGFAVRKAKISVYVMPGDADFEPILERLGPHSKGKCCLYITRLARVDEAVLAELVAAGLKDLSENWPVHGAAHQVR